MKKYLIIILLLSFTILISGEKDNFKTAEYEKPIHGFKVKIYFKPPPQDKIYWSPCGPAIIEFTDIKNEDIHTFVTHSLKMPFTYLEYEKIVEIVESEIEKTTSDIIAIKYEEPNFKPDKDGWIRFSNISEEPFFFFDINFDGKDELIITEYRTAQRTLDYYRIYGFPYDPLYDDFRHKIPFNKIDGNTSINIQDKTISKHGSISVNNFFDEIYKFESVEVGYESRYMVDKYRLDEVIIGSDDGKRTYSIEDGKISLISFERWDKYK